MFKIDSNSNTDAYSSSASRQQLQQPNYSTATLPLAGHGQQQQKTLAEIRLQMEELRRQLERSRQLESVKQEHKRNETSKDAFFRVMTRSANVIFYFCKIFLSIFLNFDLEWFGWSIAANNNAICVSHK
jgi:hypothetical protein